MVDQGSTVGSVAGACVTGLCLAIGWLDEHHAAVSVMIAAVTGLATITASLYSIWCNHAKNRRR